MPKVGKGRVGVLEQTAQYAIWKRFTCTNTIDPKLNPVIATSWRQCRENGVDLHGGRAKYVDAGSLARIRSDNRVLLETAEPIANSVFEIIKKSHFLLVLTDGHGCALHVVGDKTIGRRAKDVHFEPGTLWSNLDIGTNAIGLALSENMAIQTSGADHYCERHHAWTCSAAPIHDPAGDIVGVINLSGMYGHEHPHSLALVVAAARAISLHLVNAYNTGLLRLAMDGNSDGIILLDHRFRPVWINSTGRHLLQLPEGVVENLDFRHTLSGIDWAGIQEWSGEEQYYTNDARLAAGGKTIPCSATISPALPYGGNKVYSVTLRKQEQVIRTVNLLSGNRATYTFENIHTRNPKMQRVVNLARTFARYDGVVLIEGESGTGKELFAQSIHNDSDRRDQPFIVINCASLPRDLIESELFGYEKGAFTGALREGNPGKFELADRGTIFLDEIGELPLEFQAKLLRVVETRMVRRLGGTQEKRLDVRIIAATNLDLRAEVARGNFRGDLFFRLNVLLLSIPPLRDRPEDIGYCAERFIEHFNARYPSLAKRMDQDFLQGLEAHAWPGNVRELQNSIERAFYASSGDTLGRADLHSVTGRPEATVPSDAPSDRETRAKASLITVLTECGGNIDAAARRIGMSRASLYRRLRRLSINPRDYRDRYWKSLLAPQE